MGALTRNRGRRDGGRHGGTIAGWFAPAFRVILDKIDIGIEYGQLDVTLPDGNRRVLGGRGSGPMAAVTIHGWRALTRLATSGSIGWYEAWAKGEWSSPAPVALFDLFSRNRATVAGAARPTGFAKLLKRLDHWLRRNDRSGARRNIAYHYDLGNDFYQAWLDTGMTYSSALFAEPDQSLEGAQAAKLAAILERTGTVPGERILEIGCGWGSFVEAAARGGRHVHGITLSTEQKAWVEARMARAGLNGFKVSLTDYRDVPGSYDAVASIEMVEAVGREYWPDYLRAIARALKPGGRAAIQYIAFDDALFEGYANNVDFIQAYVFPGGMLIRESEFRAIAEAEGLSWQDRTGFGLGYAETLRQWRERFEQAAARSELPPEFDRNFIDLWRYYLMYCEGGFRGGGLDVAQVTLVREG